MSGAAIALWLCCGSATAAETLRWFEAQKPKIQARQAVNLLAAAATHGLEPQDYNASALRQSVMAAMQTQAPVPTAAAMAHLDQALTVAMERYLSDLHRGRVDPQKIRHNFSAPRDTFDAALYLQSALAAPRFSEALAEAAPHLQLYEQLRTALASYRERVDDPAWRHPLPPLARKLQPGQAYAGLAVLAERLSVLGDLPADTPAPTSYKGAVVEAVKAFQKRHGLGADGVIGKTTLAQLQVTPAARARQIELALERLRWTPLQKGPRMVVINLPEFALRAYEAQGDSILVAEEMKVVVGKALDTRTPLFNEQMRFIEFSPYWNVPPSILRNEIVPQLRRDPAYLTREGMEFVLDDGSVSRTVTPALLKAVLAGEARLRQRPGPKNALGDIKFVFPNTENIYLHHTPATQLFERDRRDFSHGCIRVEHPAALAKFVLGGMPQWTEPRIKKAMTKGESFTLKLAEPVPVLITYGTALVRDDQTYFFEDIYGLDRLLDAALREHSRRLSGTKG